MLRKVKAETVAVYTTLKEEVLTLSDTAELRVSATTRAGEPPYIDFRVWVDTDKYSGPTKKGFSIPLSDIAELKKMIARVEKGAK